MVPPDSERGPDDAWWLADAAASDPAAKAEAAALFRRLEPIARMTCAACSRGVSPDILDDRVQETLLVAWRRLPELQLQGEDLERWLRQVARFVCANARRASSDLLVEDGLVDAEDPGLDALAGLRRAEREALLASAIAAVGGIDEDVLYHRYAHGLDRPTIAAMLGLADADAVRVALQRAQRRLRVEVRTRLAALGHGSSLLRDSRP